MLKEELDVVQVEGENRRRWFSDDYFDLIVWIDENSVIDGFQLCYDIGNNERALTWLNDSGYKHNAVDEGDEPSGPIKMTPILVSDGVFAKDQIIRRFMDASSRMDKSIVDFIMQKLSEYVE